MAQNKRNANDRCQKEETRKDDSPATIMTTTKVASVFGTPHTRERRVSFRAEDGTKVSGVICNMIPWVLTVSLLFLVHTSTCQPQNFLWSPCYHNRSKGGRGN